MMKKLNQLNKTKQIDYVNVIERTAPSFLNCFLIDIYYDYKDVDKNYGHSCSSNIEIKDEKNMIKIINTLNTDIEEFGFIKTLENLYDIFKDKEPDFKLSIESILKEIKNENISVNFKDVNVVCYFDQYGRRRELLINRSFSPHFNMEIYGDLPLMDLDEEKPSKSIPKASYVLCLNDSDFDDVGRNKDFEYTYLFDETETHYHLRLNPSSLLRYGFLLDFENEYSYSDSILVLVDKQTLKLSSKQEPLFDSLKIRNRDFN